MPDVGAASKYLHVEEVDTISGHLVRISCDNVSHQLVFLCRFGHPLSVVTSNGWRPPGHTLADKTLVVIGFLLDSQTGNRASDDQLLNLRSALEDRVDLGVTVHALNVVLTGVAITTKNLNCFFSHAHCGL